MNKKVFFIPLSASILFFVAYLLLAQTGSFLSVEPALQQRHRILVRDCRSFEGLGENWLRIGLQSRRHNHRIVSAMRRELSRTPLI